MGEPTKDEAVARPVKNEQPSRWWIAYHLWGGICLKTYLDISGLTKLLLGAPSGSDPLSAAQSFATTVALVAVGAVAIGYLLSKSLVSLIESGTMTSKWKLVLKISLPIGYFASAILLAMATGPLISSTTGISKTSTPVAPSSDIKPVMAYTTIQSAEGVREADLDQTALKNLETWIIETFLQKGRNKFTEMGHNPKDFKPHVVANSVYITAGGKKLAVINIAIDNSMRSVTILGIKGKELHRVSCLRASNHDIPVWSGECGNKVGETFGVSIQP